MNAHLLFADLLNYPASDLSERANDCAAEFAMRLPRVGGLLSKFGRKQSELGINRLQEIYTRTFDMQPECTLNLSYHLFGEDQRRGMFLAKLAELYREAGVNAGNELPDHLCCLLTYLAIVSGTIAGDDLITDCMLPAISKIARGVDEASNPYRSLLDALLLWLESSRAGLSEPPAATPEGNETFVQKE